MSTQIDRVLPVPLDMPLASSGESQKSMSEPDEGGLRATTVMPFHASRPRAGRRTLRAVEQSLSDRDWNIIRCVYTHRYLTTKHLEGFFFHNHATPSTGSRVARRVISRLQTQRVLEALDRRIGGVRAGSASYVWQLGPVGLRLITTDDGTPRRRRHEPGLLFLEHTLAIADAHLELVRANRSRVIELINVELEPDCWRTYTGLGGARLTLQPDLYAVTGAGDYEDHWFVEIDRGTEHIKRLIGKCRRYEDYRRSGTEQQASGNFPLVVWAMRDAAQVKRLLGAIRADHDLDERLFRVTTPEDFLPLIQRGAA